MMSWRKPSYVCLALLFLFVSVAFAAGGPAALRQAAKRGDVEAQYRLGWMHLGGRGVKKNNKAAARWLRLAAEGGHPAAQADLGFLHAQGRGVGAKDQKTARQWFGKSLAGGLAAAAERGDVFAQTSLGRMYASGAGCGKRRDDAAARQKQGARQQCVEKDATRAAQWFRRAAEQGHGDAQGRLGLAFLTGSGVKRDERRAAEWLRRAADQGEAGAQFLLGQLYLHGQGVPKDPRLGTEWIRAADAQGVNNIRQAMNLLEK